MAIKSCCRARTDFSAELFSFCGGKEQEDCIIMCGIKGTVPPDFSPLFFFFKQLLLAPVGKPSDDLDFFLIFAELFDFSGASPVSLTPVKQMILL